MEDPRNEAPLALIQRYGSAGITETQVRKLLGAVIGAGEYQIEDLRRRGISSALLARMPPTLPRLSLTRSRTSAVDRFRKLVFTTSDGLALETVVIPLEKPGTFSVCLSSQIGCVMACQFCATARMQSRRNLATWEIVDQLVQVRTLLRSEGGRLTSVVFMGMGEPFLNYDNVVAAAQLFCFPVYGALSGRAITISTVGLVRQIDRFIGESHPFRLSISLGAATDEKRALLVPIAARTPIVEVVAAARRYAIVRRDRINLAYVCISGVNVSRDDAVALGVLIGDTPVRLDLIDVNDATGRFRPPSALELSDFRDALREHVRQPVVRRYSGGADIQAACGTLAGIPA